MYLIVLVFLLLIILGPDLFYFLKIRKYKLSKWIHLLNILPGLTFITAFIYIFSMGRNTHDPETFYDLMWVNFAFMLIYIPKLSYALFHFLNFLVNIFIPKRTNMLRWIGVVVAAAIFGLMLEGTLFVSQNYKIDKKEILVDNLAQSFDGYRIVQISDIHLGNWDSEYARIEKAIKKINELKPDLVVFTGDMVNNFKDELNGWAPYFAHIQSSDGNLAILGNHDYGDYTDWKTPEEKMANLDSIKQGIRNLGFQLLLNENTRIYKNGDSLYVAGVENWGKPPFPKYGNLTQALHGIADTIPVVLLSHDPSHWRAEVLNHKNIVLTLSGHTHAWQFAWKWKGKLHSPASRVYPEWDGLYSQGKQYLNVNRGLGYIGIPVRLLDSNPVISLIVLKSNQKVKP